MFSKKITNDGNKSHKELNDLRQSTPDNKDWSHIGFLFALVIGYNGSDPIFRAWAVNNTQLLKKYKITSMIMWPVTLILFVSIFATSLILMDNNRIFLKQSQRLETLEYTAKNAIPLFDIYSSEQPPHKIRSTTVIAIKETVDYLILFEYISNLSESNFNCANYNIWVSKYQQWPQSRNPDNPLQTKDKYAETIDNLLSELNDSNNPEIPLADIHSMSTFAGTLNSLDMNISSDYSLWSVGAGLGIWAFPPITAWILIDFGLLFWLHLKMRKWVLSSKVE